MARTKRGERVAPRDQSCERTQAELAVHVLVRSPLSRCHGEHAWCAAKTWRLKFVRHGIAANVAFGYTAAFKNQLSFRQPVHVVANEIDARDVSNVTGLQSPAFHGPFSVR